MYVQIGYKKAKERYPGLMDEVMEKIRKGKSRHKKDRPCEFVWGISWCVSVEGFSGTEFKEMIEGKRPLPNGEEDPKTEEEAVEDYKHRCEASLQASAGRASWCSTSRIPDFPQEIADFVRRDFRSEKDEEARWNAMPAGKRDEELGKILGDLRKSPGFIELRMPDFGEL